MAKTRSIIRVKLPSHTVDKASWRRAIRDAVMAADVSYEWPTALEVAVLIYLKKGKGLITRDVDNLLKHVLDALQARFGNARDNNRLIANDNCVQRVVVEKRARPKHLDDTYGGKLEIKPYVKGVWP